MESHAERVDLAVMRENYTLNGLSESAMALDWSTQFDEWMGQAVQAGLTEPNAMVLATASVSGVPATRTVLAKEVTARGVTFYTNYHSAKSRDLDENNWAAVTFPWYPLQRQIQVRGRSHRVDAATTAAYWATRPRSSQIGAWASPQSSVVADRTELDRLQMAVAERFGGEDGTVPVPVPPHWGGWRIEPATVEFWQGRTGRMHDRIRYRDTGNGWIVERLAP